MHEPQKKDQPLVQVRDLLIEFGNGRKKNKAVKGVTFDVYNGETFGLVGESGSGKTTVARAIMGMQRIADGAVYFNDKLARGKAPNLYSLSKTLERNLNILVENQISTTQKINDYVLEFKRIYYKYRESMYFDFKTGEVKPYPDKVNRRIKEGKNLKETKIVTSDKENNLKQISLLVNDSLKRLVKLVRILQKTIQFTNHLSNYIDISPELDKSITNYLNISKSKVLEIKDYENEVYFALQDIRAIRKEVKLGNITSVKMFFDQIGSDIEAMIKNHKEISEFVKSINKDIKFVQALVSPKKDRQRYILELMKIVTELENKTDVEQDSSVIKEYQNVINLLKLKNINQAIAESDMFLKPTRYSKKSLKQEMQMIFQDPASSLNDRMSVEEIIAEGLNNFPQIYENTKVLDEYLHWYNADKPAEEHLKAQQVTHKELKHYLVLKQIESVGLLPEHLSRYPHEFSGGQRQRIGIARSLIMNPKFIVADEPISALDVSIRAQVLNLLRKFQIEQNLTYIFIAHDLSVVRHIADRIAVIYRGDIVELADAEELFNNPLHPYTKSLLSAIPLADPEQEATKIHFHYDQEKEHPDYLADFPVWQEVSPNHFIYANQRELKKYKKEIEAQKELQKVKRKTTKPAAKKKVVDESKPKTASIKKTTRKATPTKVKKQTSKANDKLNYNETLATDIVTHRVEKITKKKKEKKEN